MLLIAPCQAPYSAVQFTSYEQLKKVLVQLLYVTVLIADPLCVVFQHEGHS